MTTRKNAIAANIDTAMAKLNVQATTWDLKFTGVVHRATDIAHLDGPFMCSYSLSERLSGEIVPYDVTCKHCLRAIEQQGSKTVAKQRAKVRKNCRQMLGIA